MWCTSMRTVSWPLRMRDRADVSAFGILFSVGMDNELMIKTEVKQSLDAVEACVKHGIKHIVYQYLEAYDDQPTPPYMACKEIGESVDVLVLTTLLQ